MASDLITHQDLLEFYRHPWERYWLDKVNADLEPVDPIYRRLMETVLGLLDKPRLVLDMGCGIGIHSINLVRRYPLAKVFAMDLSFPQLVTAGQLAARQKVSGQINWLNGDVESLPLSFQPDHILFTEVMEHLLDPVAALSQVRRICTSNTRLILSVPQVYGPTGMVGVFYKQILPDSGETIETQDQSRLRSNLPIYRYYHAQYSITQLRNILQQCGFFPETIQPVIFKIPLRASQTNESWMATLLRRGHNGLARGLHQLLLKQPYNIFDRQMCKMNSGLWAENLVAVCRAI